MARFVHDESWRMMQILHASFRRLAPRDLLELDSSPHCVRSGIAPSDAAGAAAGGNGAGAYRAPLLGERA